MLNMMAMLSKKHLSLPPSCVSFRPWVAQGNSNFHQYFSPNIHETRVPSTTGDPSPFSWYKTWDYQSWHVLATGIYPAVETFGPMRPLISESTQGWVMQSTKITNSCWVLLILLILLIIVIIDHFVCCQIYPDLLLLLLFLCFGFCFIQAHGFHPKPWMPWMPWMPRVTYATATLRWYFQNPPWTSSGRELRRLGAGVGDLGGHGFFRLWL